MIEDDFFGKEEETKSPLVKPGGSSRLLHTQSFKMEGGDELDQDDLVKKLLQNMEACDQNMQLGIGASLIDTTFLEEFPFRNVKYAELHVKRILNGDSLTQKGLIFYLME